MNPEFLILFTFIILLSLFYIHKNDNRVHIEAFNNIKYKVRESDDKELMKKKADYLGRLDIKAVQVINYMKENSIPNNEIATRLQTRYSNASLSETPITDEGAAYTINKGPICICIEKNGKFNDENDAFFVILHELAHIMSNSYGHGPEFKENFNVIVKVAVKLELWKEANYEKKPEVFCGVEITSSPCDKKACNKNNLDHFFKERLLD